MTTPKKARFAQIIEADGYKLIPANKTAATFCAAYGTTKLRISEAISLKIAPEQIEWIA